MAETSIAHALPAAGRLLGLDFGERRVGLALSNPEQTIATPLENYTRQNDLLDARLLMKTVRDYRVVGVVVGLPIHLSGDEGVKARESRAYGAWVAQTTGLPVGYHDERFTTAVAEDYLLAADYSRKKRKARRDMLAAQIMLQSFLANRAGQAAPGG